MSKGTAEALALEINQLLAKRLPMQASEVAIALGAVLSAYIGSVRDHSRCEELLEDTIRRIRLSTHKIHVEATMN